MKPRGVGVVGLLATAFIAVKRCRFPIYPLGHIVSDTSSTVTRGALLFAALAIARCPFWKGGGACSTVRTTVSHCQCAASRQPATGTAAVEAPKKTTARFPLGSFDSTLWTLTLVPRVCSLASLHRRAQKHRAVCTRAKPRVAIAVALHVASSLATAPMKEEA